MVQITAFWVVFLVCWFGFGFGFFLSLESWSSVNERIDRSVAGLAQTYMTTS